MYASFFFFNDTAPTETYTLSLHDALPIFLRRGLSLPPTGRQSNGNLPIFQIRGSVLITPPICTARDRKSTRLNSSHTVISYAVFCLKKKKSPTSDCGQEEEDQTGETRA